MNRFCSRSILLLSSMYFFFLHRLLPISFLISSITFKVSCYARYRSLYVLVLSSLLFIHPSILILYENAYCTTFAIENSLFSNMGCFCPPSICLLVNPFFLRSPKKTAIETFFFYVHKCIARWLQNWQSKSSLSRQILKICLKSLTVWPCCQYISNKKKKKKKKWIMIYWIMKDFQMSF